MKTLNKYAKLCAKIFISFQEIGKKRYGFFCRNLYRCRKGEIKLFKTVIE